MTIPTIQAAYYDGLQVHWEPVTNTLTQSHSSNRSATEPGMNHSTTWYHAPALIRFCGNQRPFSIRGPLLHNNTLLNQYNFRAYDTDDLEDFAGQRSIDAKLVEEAFAKRLQGYTPSHDDSINYLSEPFVKTVFTPAIPSTPLLSCALKLSNWHWTLGLFPGIPLLIVEFALRTIFNIGLSIAIAVKRLYDPAEAELLQLRSLMNSKDPTQAMMFCLNGSR